MGERSLRRVRDLVTQLAFEGLSENEIGRARISMMARSDLLHARAGYRSARPTTLLKIQLATHGQSIQLGQGRPSEMRGDIAGIPPRADEALHCGLRQHRVMSRNARCEQVKSAVPPKAALLSSRVLPSDQVFDQRAHVSAHPVNPDACLGPS